MGWFSFQQRIHGRTREVKKKRFIVFYFYLSHITTFALVVEQVSGMSTVHALGRLGSKSGEPIARVVVAACGEVTARRSR